MSKRTPAELQRKRRARDRYDTPPKAVLPLLEHLPKGATFAEPCAGRGFLIDALAAQGHPCAAASDIAPRRADICKKDARNLTVMDVGHADFVITNTPWSRLMLPLMHELIVLFSDLKPSWILIYADWVHTKQAIPYMPRLRIIQSIGRVRWIEGTKSVGFDNCAWHLFDRPSYQPTVFCGRVRDLDRG